MILKNKYNLPQSFVDLIQNITYDIRQKEPNTISVSVLNNPPRINQLMLRYWDRIEDDVANNLWRILGQCIHGVMSKTKHDNRLIEEKIEYEIDGIKLIGRPDLYDEPTKTVEDYKVTSVWSVKDIKEEWEQQLNLYAFLLSKTGFLVEKAKINAILRDWSEREWFMNKQTYPPIPFKTIDIPLWRPEQQEQYVRDRIKLHKEAINLSDIDLVVCSEKERWKIPDKYAVIGKNLKRATKLCLSKEEAKEFLGGLNDIKNKYKIEKRQGIDVRCSKYCLCNKFCSYFLDTYEKINPFRTVGK
jgi:hypothetical protein